MNQSYEPDEQFERLVRDFQQNVSDEKIRRDCLQRVVSWRRASDEMFSAAPFDAEMRGDVLKREWQTEMTSVLESPTKDFSNSTCCWYGFDVDGEAVVQDRGSNAVYFRRSDGEVTAYRYSNGSLQNLTWYSPRTRVSLFVDEKFRRFLRIYQYDDRGKVIRCDYDPPNGKLIVSEFVYNDVDGQLESQLDLTTLRNIRSKKLLP